MSERKIILFGGTFDPIHSGHVVVAKAAVEYIGARKAIFVPAGISPSNLVQESGILFSIFTTTFNS